MDLRDNVPLDWRSNKNKDVGCDEQHRKTNKKGSGVVDPAAPTATDLNPLIFKVAYGLESRLDVNKSCYRYRFRQ
jgi:hypothetical protein